MSQSLYLEDVLLLQMQQAISMKMQQTPPTAATITAHSNSHIPISDSGKRKYRSCVPPGICLISIKSPNQIIQPLPSPLISMLE
ncbi:hypothetical protein G4B88_010314 [Cannabis sativa]|uniref:Uncharacterized protein n=1 Tax=Cannabis sativa TaxID=3483 RepID=A0A7J6I5K0_CANSA|nr:hypothetical protein G4B88_010314 [Cannabis sativa]